MTNKIEHPLVDLITQRIVFLFLVVMIAIMFYMTVLFFALANIESPCGNLAKFCKGPDQSACMEIMAERCRKEEW